MADPELKYNVRDIPIDKHEEIGVNANVGIANIKCYIDYHCPFSATPRQEYTIIFNENTLPSLIKAGAKDIEGILTTSSGSEGIYFQPKYVYRNNYLYEIKMDRDESGKIITNFIGNPEFFTVEIPFGAGKVAGADNTNYHFEQSWLAVESVFDKHLFNNREDTGSVEIAGAGCGFSPVWRYNSQKVNSDATEKDVEYDYESSFYNANRDIINVNNIQMPVQSAGEDLDGNGMHWRVLKRSDLFRGEDFFIEFHKQSKSSNANRADKDPIPFGIDYYAPLDVSLDPKTVLEFYPGTNIKVPINNAFRKIGEEFEKTFDLSDQSYYVIEMGYRSPDENYFIIICERSNPIFVHIEGQKWTAQRYSGVSKVLSLCDTISGKALIDSDYFRITVRNHLGSLIIIFDGKGFSTDPWIVKRRDFEQQDGHLVEKDTNIFVPRGRMTIWGGNLISGFMFGPLQYTQRHAYIPYPPSYLRSSDGTNIIYMDPDEITPLPTSCNLPAGAIHNIKLTATDYTDFIDLKNDEDSIINSMSEPLFTQDAQYFYEEHGGESKLFNGYFFYQDRLKELSGNIENFNIGFMPSYISVKKSPGTSQDDIAQRFEHFVVDIDMRVGDHHFEENNYEWNLTLCKTPILTSLRLISEESLENRWELDRTEVSDYVMHYSDTWSTTSFHEIQHTGTIKFLLKDINLKNDNEEENGNKVDLLRSLKNKAFYISVWAGYSSSPEGENKTCSTYTKMEGYYALFTGICYGGELDTTYSRQIMTCKINDYSKILKDQVFFNAPFYDGVKDMYAVYDILRLGGFKTTSPFDPGSLLKYMVETGYSDSTTGQLDFPYVDGRRIKVSNFALPAAYRRLDQPAFKFKLATPLYDGVIKIAKQSGKIFYFDQYGVAHFEEYIDILDALAMGLDSPDILFRFTSFPERYEGQLIFDVFEHSYAVSETYNYNKIVSNTPDFTPMFYDDINWNSIDQPESEGFLGYPKMWYQQEGMFGSYEAVKRIADLYRVRFRPPLKMSFETYGLPLRALDFVSLNDAYGRVTSVTHNIDPSVNKWWMTVECEKYQPVKEVDTVTT